MRKFPKDFEEAEVRISRVEFAEMSSRVVNRFLDAMAFGMDEVTDRDKHNARILCTALLGALMIEMFEGSELEVEENE